MLLLLAPVFPPIHPPAFYSPKGVEEFAAKINEFGFTHHPRRVRGGSCAAHGRGEEQEKEDCKHRQGTAWPWAGAVGALGAG